MSVLICGGAGYIGSHCIRAFAEHGEDLVVLDNLETGHREAVPPYVKFYEADLRDDLALTRVFRENHIEAVIHFCAYSLVGESVENPLKYFENNVGGMISLLQKVQAFGVQQMVFSSSAAVYGEPTHVPILETDPTQPTNPYGESKRMMEKMIDWVSKICPLRYVSLRYFNVAGASLTGDIGEDHRPETHLIPLILQVPLGRRKKMMIFGDQYPTKDGTCIRDYIHVDDVARAHWNALDYLRHQNQSMICNLGSGTGYSVKEMISAAQKVTQYDIPVEVTQNRPGDPAKLVADIQRARDTLHWEPRITNIEEIIESAWKWHRSHPNGYTNSVV